MKTLASVIGLLLLAASLAAGFAATSDEETTIEQFAWLAGHWKGRMEGGRVAEQLWTRSAAGLMMGSFRLLEGEKTLVLEFFTFRETPAGLELRVRHFSPALEPWEKEEALLLQLVSYDGTRAVFDNPVHTRPKRTFLTRHGPDAFTSRSEIMGEEGAQRVIELTLHRVNPWERALHKEVTVPAPLEAVWTAWTTTEGVTTFFGPAAHVEASVGGLYEIYFNPSAPQGLRGSEDCKVHSVVPMKLFSFEWNAPPAVPAIRTAGLHTLVYVRFFEESRNQTRVEVTHTGWGVGGDWDKTYNYFDEAWDAVLGNLRYRFTVGPVDWPGHFIRAGQPSGK